MKILHTSDWHAGRTLFKQSRIDEMRAALSEVCDIAEAEEVDAVIVAGDVFQSASPPPEAEQLVYEALEQFCRQETPVVLLTGNHDSPKRWHALAPLLRRFSVHVVDELRMPDDGGIIEVSSRDGKECLQVAAVPWVSERRLGGADLMMAAGSETYKTYADGMALGIARLCTGMDPDKCNLLAAHIFIANSVVGASEYPLTIGEIYAVTGQAIPATIQYAALGHVHKPQQPPGVPTPVRYSGSLLQLDFGETGQEKSVVIAELEAGLPATLREIPITSGKRLLDVTGTLESLEQYRTGDEDVYLRVHVKCDQPTPGLSDSVRDMLPNALSVHLVYESRESDVTFEVRSKSSRELFDAYYTARYDSSADAELLDLFEQLVGEAAKQ